MARQLALSTISIEEPTMSKEHEYTFAKLPKPVGWWVLYPQGSITTQFSMYHKPTDEQIKNTEQLLGWEWKDAV
jgi:hypothetical protein